MTNLRATLGLSLQRALLGEIPPQLRGVEVRLGNAQADLLFYFDGPISEANLETISEIESEVLADMPSDYKIESRPVITAGPAALPDTGFWVYRRKDS